ncbi:MAG: LLM class flavin-dependent oxidoreductase [Sandaracinus sp.]|nr:LLM class flavin-dependent oxidoreductase [Sandaracinus sp.]MCB9632632.1 LLM class flavin-dependent oxidoreductase [Sandaracinus sp.]
MPSLGSTPVPFSVLDLAPVSAGVSIGDSLHRSISLARHVEALGFTRFWLAEHHAMPTIASAAPDLLAGQVAAATTTIRVGSGGIMLPNHAPLMVAERFGTLESMFPGRIDLGVGRAPGSDRLTAFALRRPNDPRDAGDLAGQLDELESFFSGRWPAGHPYAAIHAVPGEGARPPIFVLGSSDYGARLAAQRSLPYAYAHHFAPQGTDVAMRLYREGFVGKDGATPHAIVAVAVLCAPTDDEARRLSQSMALAYARLVRGAPTPIPTVEEALSHAWTPAERAAAESFMSSHVIGSPDRVRDALVALADRTRADELMITTSAHSFEVRLRSFELLAEAFA